MSTSISSVRSAPVRASETAEGPGPEKVADGDADEAAKAAKAAPPPNGMGKVVDKTA